MFHLDQSVNIAGTHGIDAVSLPPAFLVARFGPPGRGTGDGKVSGQYKFTDDAGNIFTLYDYKSTTLYYGEEGNWPTPAEFWTDEEPHQFSIGGRGGNNRFGDNNPQATAFCDWLLGLYLGCHFVQAN